MKIPMQVPHSLNTDMNQLLILYILGQRIVHVASVNSYDTASLFQSLLGLMKQESTLYNEVLKKMQKKDSLKESGNSISRVETKTNLSKWRTSGRKQKS